MYRVSYLYSLFDKAVVWTSIDVGFHSKFSCSFGIALSDEVVHYELIEITAYNKSASCPALVPELLSKLLFVSESKKIVFLFKIFQRDSHFVINASFGGQVR